MGYTKAAIQGDSSASSRRSVK